MTAARAARMRRGSCWLTGLILLAVLAALASAGSPAAQAGSCQLATGTRYHGHPATRNCGPATATLRIGTRTYTFSSGTCQVDAKKADRAAFTLALGTSVLATRNAGAPLLTLSATVTIRQAVISAFSGGRQLARARAVSVGGAIPGRGTFASRSGSPAISGSWNCHGKIGRLS